jgi:hypothetical protein
VAAASRSAPMVELTQVPEVPELSESRYWCISFGEKASTIIHCFQSNLLTDSNVVVGVFDGTEGGTVSRGNPT